MRAYKFRLQKILEIKEYAEQQAEIELAKITSECLNLEKKIKECRQELSHSLYGGVGTLDMSVLSSSEHYRQLLFQREKNTTKILQERLKVKEKVRLKYLETSKERKVLDKLKEKKAEEFRIEQYKEEEKMLEEVSSGAEARKKNQSIGG